MPNSGQVICRAQIPRNVIQKGESNAHRIGTYFGNVEMGFNPGDNLAGAGAFVIKVYTLNSTVHITIKIMPTK